MVRALTVTLFAITSVNCYEIESRSLDEERIPSTSVDSGHDAVGSEPQVEECRRDADCAVACRGQCCTCPQVVSRRALATDPELQEPRTYGCRSICTERCGQCPSDPVPTCVRGQCVPQVGCTVEGDCLLARDCRCGCVEAVSLSVMLRDPCLARIDDEGSCQECQDDDDCRPCPPEPERAMCGAGWCMPDLGSGALLAPCGGQLGDCPSGFNCFPGEEECGFGSSGVCIPTERPKCGGGSGTPCRYGTQQCLSRRDCSTCEGVCLTPSEVDHVCAVAPACFACRD
jgi:hypothetical protein